MDLPLTGGRVDEVAGRPAAVMVYAHGKHEVDLFAWPDRGADLPGAGLTHGFRTTFWKQGDMDFAAVSDVDQAAFQKFVALAAKPAGIKPAPAKSPSRNPETSAMTDTTNRRDALKCLGVGAGTLFTLQGGVFSAFDLAEAREDMGTPLFLQISDTHIGFNKEANPDVIGTLNRTIDMVNAMPKQPGLILHTGDVSHLSKASEFDTANQLLSRLRVTELHVVPGEHDVTDGPGTEFFARFGKAVQQSRLLQLRCPWRAFRRPGQCDELQAQRVGRAWR